MERIEIGTPETIQYRDPDLDQSEYREFLETAKQRGVEQMVEVEVVDEEKEK